MNVYIKFMKFNVLLIKFYIKKFTLNFINFQNFEKYIKFYVHVHKYTF